MSPQNVLLVSPNLETIPMPVYPLSLPRLAGAAARAGHRTRQVDLLVQGREDFPRIMADFPPDLVALSLRNIDNQDAAACRTYLPGYREILELIRAHTQAPVVLGGPGFSLFPRELLEILGADCGVVGPGEGPLAHLLSLLEAGEESLPRLLAGGRPGDGACLPGPGHHDPQLVAYYWQHGGMIGLQTKSGCTRQCSYCTYPFIEGKKLRFADPDLLLAEIRSLVQDHGVTHFYFVDSLFNQDRDRELSLAEALIQADLPLSWCAFFAPAHLDREYLETLKRSGLTHLEFGTEALSDLMLGAYGKGFTAAEAVANSRLAGELGLFTCHYLLFGGPGETPATIRETLQNARELKNSVFFPFVGVRLYPGTLLFDRAQAEGQVQDAADCLNPVFYQTPEMSQEEIWEWLRKGTAGSGAWVFPADYEAMGRILKRLRKRGLKGPLWEYLLRN